VSGRRERLGGTNKMELRIMANFTVPTNNTTKTKDDIEWSNVDPTSLPKALESKYAKLRSAMEMLVEAKTDFENDFSNACSVAAGHKMIFSYRYGLACGVVPEKVSTSKGKVAFGSLARKAK
jgi:hypothetical protein